MISGDLVDLIGSAVAALLTFFVFGYLLGDVPGIGGLFRFLYRLALHILIGAGAAFAFLAAVSSVLYPRVFIPLWQLAGGAYGAAEALGLAVMGAGLSVVLWFKLSKSLAWVGNLSTAYLVGVGAGVSIGGAVLGTLVPQSAATALLRGTLVGANTVSNVNTVDGVIVLVGTLAVFVSFTFASAWRKGLTGVLSRVVGAVSILGRFFLYIALGAAFAGVYAASVAVFAGQVQALQGYLQVVMAALAKFGIGQ